MDERYEIVNFGNSIPIRCFIHRLGYSARHWHNSIELLFVISGEVNVTVNNDPFTLSQDDILLINSNDIHELHAKECVLFAVQIETTLFDHRVVDVSDFRFDCNSRTATDQDRFLNIKKIIAQFIKVNADEAEGNSIEIIGMALSYSLLYELMTYFKVENSIFSQDQTKKRLDRLIRILNHINEHYREDLSLSELAKQEHLSIPYLSKFFSKNMNMNFLTYLNKLRMETAVAELLNSDESVETVAYNSGFPNPRAFVQLFKKQYNMLPSQYRLQNQGIALSNIDQIPQQIGNEYVILEHHNYLSTLANYLDKENDIKIHYDYREETNSITKTIDTLKPPSLLTHTFKTFTSVGKAKEILYTEVQTMLRTLQKEIGYEYIKFHGILSDDMMVYTENHKGEVIISFALVDKVLDFLISIGLKPLIQLSFMPKALAKYPDKTVFHSGFITSEPEDIKKWNHLIQKFTLHLIERYGIEQVTQWKFTVWNEPDTPQSMFAMSSNEVFYNFYKNTYETVKACSPDLLFGSPSSYYLALYEGNWIYDFTKWCTANQCMPDFVNVHFYGTEFTSDAEQLKQTWDLVGGLKLSSDPDIFKKFVDMLRNYVDSSYGSDCKLYLTEWNSTPSHFDLISDTCFKSCYIVKNILENYDRLDSFGFWVLTDFFEENPIPEELFHGGLGLFTYNGIKKPGYYAFHFLSKLGCELIGKGDGFFVTREKGEYRILFYNYKHYSSLYAKGEMFDMTFTDRYTPFGSADKKEFNLLLKGVNDTTFEVTEHIVNREHGSCFDKWVEMGARRLTTVEEIDTLSSLSRPMINKYTIASSENTLDVNVILDLLEIRLLIIRPAAAQSPF